MRNEVSNDKKRFFAKLKEITIFVLACKKMSECPGTSCGEPNMFLYDLESGEKGYTITEITRHSLLEIHTFRVELFILYAKMNCKGGPSSNARIAIIINSND